MENSPGLTLNDTENDELVPDAVVTATLVLNPPNCQGICMLTWLGLTKERGAAIPPTCTLVPARVVGHGVCVAADAVAEARLLPNIAAKLPAVTAPLKLAPFTTEFITGVCAAAKHENRLIHRTVLCQGLIAAECSTIGRYFAATLASSNDAR